MSNKKRFANGILGLAVCVCVALFVFATFLADLPAQMRGLYQLVAVVGGVLFALALNLSVTTKLNLIVSLSSLVITLYLSEFALLFWPQTANANQPVTNAERAAVARANGLTFDLRSLAEINAARDLPFVPLIPANLHRPGDPAFIGRNTLYPLGGIAQSPTLFCNESGAYVSYESDEYGFRNRLGSWQSEVTVVLVGDSFAHGQCVESAEHLAPLLTTNDRHVLTASLSASGPLAELAILKEYVEPIAPPIVIWFYYEGNDLLDLLQEENVESLTSYLDPKFSQGLTARQPEIDAILSNVLTNGRADQPVTDSYNLVNFIKLHNINELVFTVMQPTREERIRANTLPLLSTILAEAKARTEAWGGDFYFVYLPAWNRYNEDAIVTTFYRREILDLVAAQSITLIDAHEPFAAHPDPLSLFPFRLNGHYTAEGYRLIAEQIEAHLAAR